MSRGGERAHLAGRVRRVLMFGRNNFGTTPVTLHSSRSILMGAAFGLCVCLPALAASRPLAGSVVPFDASVRVLGEADAAAPVHFQVALRLRDSAGLSARIAAGQKLTPAELAANHFPTQQDHDAVVAWLRGEGLTIDAIVPSRMTISASGDAAHVSRALGVHFAHIVSEAQEFTAADSAPAIPEALAGIVLSINGLQPQLHAHYQHSGLKPLVGGTVPYIPSDLLNAYSANGQGDGAGTTTAIVIDTFPKKTDLTAFWTAAGVPQSLSNITFIQAVPGTLPALSGEESLDTQYSSSMGSASKVRVYASQSLSFTKLDTTFQKVITDLQAGVVITQVSISLGACETSVPQGTANTDDQYFATMTALGASVFVSTGDSGSRECSGTKNVPSFFSTSPNVAAVGGTTLKLNGAKVSSEKGWSGSGGGLSQRFSKPSYQSALSYTVRAVPDLSDDADPNTGVLVIINGMPEQIGGTSVSSPVTAGLMGLVNAHRLSAGKSTLGLLDTRIYPLLGTANFRDIKHGSNGGYAAGIGYDLVTGIGAPLLSKLLPALVKQP